MNNEIEVWGHKTYRQFRIYWILEEYNLKYKVLTENLEYNKKSKSINKN